MMAGEAVYLYIIQKNEILVARVIRCFLPNYAAHFISHFLRLSEPNVGNDRGLLSNMANQAREEIGAEPLSVVADRGYYKGLEIVEDDQHDHRRFRCGFGASHDHPT